MNAYLVDAGSYDSPLGNCGRDVELVFACTPGKAKSVRCRQGQLGAYSHIRYSEYLELRAYLVAKDISRQEGIANHDDSLWGMPCPGLERAIAKEGEG